MPLVSSRKFFKDLEKKLKEQNMPFEERVGEHMAYRAALYMLRGKDSDFMTGDEDAFDPSELEPMAQDLKALGIKTYAKRCYGGAKEEDVDLKKLCFQGFLYPAVGILEQKGYPLMAGEARREELLGTLRKRERKGKTTCTDHWLRQSGRQEEERSKGPYQEKDEAVYEYEAPKEVWKDYIAGTFYRENMGSFRLTEENVRLLKELPFDKLALRNKRTVEKIRRGELPAIAADRQKVEDSFTFRADRDLGQAQLSAMHLHREMQGLTGEAARSQEWKEVMSAVQDFTMAKEKQDAAAESARVLLAVEKFTKGKKNARQDPEVKACVDMALRAVGVTVPDAARNPSVKPLIDRFNDVRRRRFQKPVTLEGNTSRSAATPVETILEDARKQTASFSKQLTDENTMVYHGEDMELTSLYTLDPVETAENMALAVALEEVDRGTLKPRDFEKRLETLREDPNLRDMARETSERPDVQFQLQYNAASLGSYIKEKYERWPWDKLDAKLQQDVQELGSDYFSEVPYEPQAAKELFAGLLAMDEMKQRQASGEPVSFRELEERKRDLMEDEALEKMAGTLPSSPDFRRIIKRSLTGVTSKEELTRALKETFRRGGELAPERRGRHLRDCYEEQRQSAERLMNIQPVRNYRQGQAVELMANLIALREQEQKSGGPDAPVDEQALARRVEELRKDQTVLKLAEGAILARETGKDRKVGEEAPEQLLAREVFSQYQKANPVKAPAPPEGPEAQPEEPVL